jgi:hypothetical protein
MARLRDRAPKVFGANLRKRDEVLFDLPAQAAQIDHSVMSAIETGRHVERCENRAHTRIAYNSCRNRHCPKCQGARQAVARNVKPSC